MDINQQTLEALAQAQIERTPMARFAFWVNNRRRPDKNDAHFTGRVQISTVKVAEVLADALQAGKTEIELWADLWQNEPRNENSPVLSGKARTLVAAKQETPAETVAA